MQTTSELLMIRPVNFGFNSETAVNNSFQQKKSDADIQEKALAEFDGFVDLLRENGIHVHVVEDSPLPFTPDSIFPNNWISFHEDGRLFLYPMFAVNRRAERKPEVLNMVKEKFVVSGIVDLSPAEQKDRFLEGTGSMVLDRDYRIAYVCLSPRSDKELLDEFCRQAGYQPVIFSATDVNGTAIYHTNVMMCIATSYAVVCLDAVTDPAARNMLIASLQNTGKEIIEITQDQLGRFAGNMLQLKNSRGELLLVMSTQAYHSLSAGQVAKLERHNRIVHATLFTIEAAGGGSARCMLAEIFLQPK